MYLIITQMFKINEFSVNEIIKVLIDDNGVEEELYAKICNINSTSLNVKYLSETNRIYKDATLYKFDEEENTVELESITEHYEETYKLDEIGFLEIEPEYFALESEIDSEESDSEIDEEDSCSENSFVVSDDPMDWEQPADHAEIDEQWNSWIPQTEGERNFKNKINRIEMMVKIHKDNMDFDKNNV
jgi:hypothetical protein